MKAVIIALVLIAGAIAQEQQALKQLFNSWKQQYSKEYPDEAEEAARFEVFAQTYQRIVAWNAQGNTATLALNKFSDLTNEEFGAIYCGTIPASPEVVEAGIVEINDVQAPPASWDWRTEGAVTPIKNQGQCGSCWAFATVAVNEGLYKINGNTLTSMSEQQIVDCSHNGNQGCNGGIPSVALTYVQNNGLETEQEYPYTAKNGQCKYNKGDAIQTGDQGPAFVTPRSATALTAAVYQQPVIIVVEADQDVFQSYSSGVIGSGCGVALDHAITAIGYGTESGQGAFIVKNSWGTDWGVNGYVYISSSTSFNSGAGACGIFSQPVYPKGIKA